MAAPDKFSRYTFQTRNIHLDAVTVADDSPVGKALVASQRESAKMAQVIQLQVRQIIDAIQQTQKKLDDLIDHVNSLHP